MKRNKGIELNRRGSGRTLFISFVLMAVVVMLAGGLGIWSIERESGRLRDVVQGRIAQEKLVAQMKADLKGCRFHLLQAAMASGGEGGFEYNKNACEEENRRLVSNCDLILKGGPLPGLSKEASGSGLEPAVLSVKKETEEFAAVAGRLLSRKAELLGEAGEGGGNRDAIRALGDERLNRLLRDEIPAAGDRLATGIDDLQTMVAGVTDRAIHEVSVMQQGARNVVALATVSATLLALILGVLAVRDLRKRVGMIAEAMEKGAAGDLALKVVSDSGDDLGILGEKFNSFTEKLASTVGKVNKSTEELSRISGNLSETAGQVVVAARRQADGVLNASSAMTQISATLKGVTQGVDSLSQSAAESSSSILEISASIEEVALNVATLAQSVEDVSSSIVQMATSSKEIDTSVTSLTETIASTASSVMEMDSSIRQVEKNAMDTAAISEDVRRDAETGKEAVVATEAGIREIKRSSGITYEVINTLSERADEIGTILSVIDEVAEQTNLLALNAAIIAAQSGERGKGFAVVADEIKELAERTSISTREIAQVIKGVQDETRRAVEAISQAEKCITDGELLSQKSGEALNKIVMGVEKASAQMEEIARTTIEQAKGSEMIRDAMEHVLEMVTQIAMATREQGMGGELIMAAVEMMKDLTAQVSSSTREQSEVGNFIARSTENITGMIQQIKRACDEQSRGSGQIVVAVEDIKHSTNINLDATNVLNDAVARLTHHIAVMRKETGDFRIG